MDTGQMMAVMQQMPTGVVAQQVGEPVVVLERNGGSFAGLLQDISMQQTDLAELAGQAVLLKEVAGQLTGVEAMGDAMTTLLKLAGGNEKALTALQKDSNAAELDRSALQDTLDAASQNVMLDLNGAQLALLISQLQGRMPETGIATASTSKVSQASPHDQDVSGTHGCADLTQIGGEVSMPKVTTVADGISSAGTALTTGLDVSSQEVAATTASAQEPPMATVPGGKERLPSPSVQGAVPTPPQKEVAVTEGDVALVMKPTVTVGPAANTPLAASKVGLTQSEITVAQSSWDAQQVATATQRQQATMETRTPDVVAEVVVRSTPAPQPSAMVEQVVFGTENRVLQLEPQAPQRRADSVVSAQPVPVPVQVGKQEPVLAEVSVPQAGMALQQEQTTKQRPVTALTAQSAVVATTAADGRAEVVTVRPEQRETSKIQQNEKISSPNVSAAVTAGEKQTGSDQQDMPERGMNENFQAHLFHQQVKTEGSLTVNSASGTVQNDLSRTTPAPEQVAQQVRDRFNAHETKQGSEQIVLRLSPDHLGELKVNLNLDGQRLKVEIVAENRMVRESLMQHTDALKESLSRQNIKMESFDVTTGGNSSTDSGRSQGEWRELAQRRQHNAWMPEGGYRLAKQVTPAIVAYQRTSEHAMVDLHY